MLLLGSALAAVSGSAAVGAQSSCNVATAVTSATGAYDHHRNNGNAQTATAAYRVLIALGATLPAWTGSQISGAAPTTPITEAQLRAITTARSDTWAGWNAVYTALSCLESAPPVVTVSGGAAVTEGADASFTLTAFPAPGANLTVNVTVADSGDFVAGGDEGADTVTIGASGTATYTVATVDDATDEPDGSVKVTVNAGTGYTPANPPSAAVTVNDNDAVPGVAEPAGHKQPALTATVVNNGANSRIMVRVPDGLEGVRTVRFDPVTTAIRGSDKSFAPPGATVTALGGHSCSDGADVVTSVVETGSGQNRVGPGADGIWGNGDDDMKWGPIMVTKALPGPNIAKRSGQVAHVPVELCPGSEGKTFGLTWNLIPRNAVFEPDSFAHDAPNCKDRTYRREASAAGTGTHRGQTYTIPAIPALTVHQAHRCWTTVTIVGQDGGMGAVEEFEVQSLEPDREAAEQESAGPVCVSAGLLADVEGYAAETWRESADHVPRWSRVLAAFGQDNAYSSDPMAAVEAQTYADRGWGRWVPVTAALQCLEAAAAEQAESESQPAQESTPPPPVTPLVSIAAGPDVAEGADAVFTVTAAPAPASDLDVSVDVSQNGGYAAAGSRTVTIGVSGSATFAVATTDDGVDEPDGSVTATVNSGTGYTVSSSNGDATVAVSDDDVPHISIAAGADVTEGDDATFTITADPAPHAGLSVDVAVTQSGDPGAATGTRTVTIPAGGAYTLTVATTDDGADEADGSVTAAVNTGSGYTVSATAGTATVAVFDDDDPPAEDTGDGGTSEGGTSPAGPPTVTVSDAVAGEGAQELRFAVTLSHPNPHDITFRYGAFGVTAAYGHDFAQTYQAFTLEAGDTGLDIVVPVTDDDTPEGDETLTVFVYATEGINIPGYFIYANGTITDND